MLQKNIFLFRMFEKNKKNILFLEFNKNKKILVTNKNIYAINNKEKKFEETYLSKMIPLIIKNTLAFKNNGLTSLQIHLFNIKC